ncbi:MAG TPA: hypothetical protein VFY49_15500, partial [Myxococcota bacterium]|nr:hypothetical protein [Myxococcota bacterium]
MRSLLAAFALLLPLAADAASVSLSHVPYYPGTENLAEQGGTLTFEVHVTANAGEMDDVVQGNISYTDAFVNTAVSQNEQFALPGGWLPGVLDCTTARCRAFNQVRP